MGIDEIAMLRDGREAMTREQCLDFTDIDGEGKLHAVRFERGRTACRNRAPQRVLHGFHATRRITQRLLQRGD